MKFNKLALITAIALIAPVSLTGCIDRTERVEVETRTDPAPVIVPDRGDVDVNVQTEPQSPPDIIERETNTNTTIERDSSTGEVQSETRTESTTVN